MHEQRIMAALARSKRSCAVRFDQVFDYDRDDSVEKIGHTDTTLAAMMQPNWQAKLLHPKGKNKDVGTVLGTAIVRLDTHPLALSSRGPPRLCCGTRRTALPVTQQMRALPRSARRVPAPLRRVDSLDK